MDITLFNDARLLAVFELRLCASHWAQDVTQVRCSSHCCCCCRCCWIDRPLWVGFHTSTSASGAMFIVIRLGHIQERCRCPVTQEEHLWRNPRQNCCPEKNFNDKFRFMGPVVLLVYGCYCEEMWFEAVTTPLTPKGLFYQGHGSIKKQITWGLFFFFFLIYFFLMCGGNATSWTSAQTLRVRLVSPSSV